MVLVAGWAVGVLLVAVVGSPDGSIKLLTEFRFPSNIFFRRRRTKLEVGDGEPGLVSDILNREKSDLILEFGTSPKLHSDDASTVDEANRSLPGAASKVVDCAPWPI